MLKVSDSGCSQCLHPCIDHRIQQLPIYFVQQTVLVTRGASNIKKVTILAWADGDTKQICTIRVFERKRRL